MKPLFFTAVVSLLYIGTNFVEGKLESSPKSYLGYDNRTVVENSMAGPRQLQSSGLAVCDGEKFIPDPDKYYTIGTVQNNFVWNHELFSAEEDSNSPNFIVQFRPTDTFADKMSAMWRFVPVNSSPEKFYLFNRRSGQPINKKGEVIVKDQELVVFARCDSTGTSVKIGDLNLRDERITKCHKSWRTCDGVLPGEGWTELDEFRDDCLFAVRKKCTRQDIGPIPVVKSIETIQTGCKKNSRTCASMFGEGWHQEARRGSNCWVGSSRYTCKKEKKNTDTANWLVKEVTKFNRINGPSLSSTKIDLEDDTPDAFSASQLIALAGTAGGGVLTGLTGCPFCGALFSVGVGLTGGALFPPKDNIEERLEQLAQQILDVTEEMIAKGIATREIEQAVNKMRLRRSFLQNEYLGDKHKLFSTGNVDDIAQLVLTMDGEIRRYDEDIVEIFGTGVGRSTGDIVRAFLGFDVLTYSLMELLAVRQETYLLQSYRFPEESCAYLAKFEFLQDKAADARDLLVNVQDQILYHRVEERCCRVKARQFLSVSSSPSIEETLDGPTAVYVSNLRLDGPQAGKISNVKEAREHDIKHLSFPIDVFLRYFDGYEEFSIAMCEAVRTDPVVRTRFQTDTITPDPLCGSEAESCLGAIDCCSGNCENNKCTAP